MIKYEILEERMKNLVQENSKEHTEILNEMNGINRKLDEAFVTKHEFAPVKGIVYGMVSIILATIIGTFLLQIVK